MKFVFNGEKMYEVTSEWWEQEPFRNHPHTGIDLKIPSDTDLYSPIEGVVSIADYGDQSTGKTVFVDNGNETVIFGHLSDIDVKEGETISVGELLGQSGSSGHSTGSHLHIGLKDQEGNFINPEHIEEKFQEVAMKMSEAEEKGGGGFSNFIEGFMNFKDYVSSVKAEGFWEATFDKPFPDLIVEVSRSIIEFTFSYNDLFLIYPAVGFMFLTFLIGKNKFTKWIVPLWFGYFVTTILRHVYFGG